MRRMLFIVALVLALSSARAASAHSCSTAVEIDVGAESAVTFGVPAEDKAVVAVEAAVPRGFTVASTRTEPGWTATRRESKISVGGAKWDPFTCGYFQVTGTATRKAVLVFPLTVTHEDGTTRRLTSRLIGAPDAAQLVYAGVDPTVGESDARSARPWRAAAVLGAVALAVLFVSRKRIKRALRSRQQRRQRERARKRRASVSA